MKSQVILVHLSLVVLIACSLIVTRDSCLAQTTSSETSLVKLDEYGNLSTDDEAARLDLFADRLFKRADLHGYIVAYNKPQMERGYFLRRIYGIGRYLTEARGVEANRIVVVDGGYKDSFTTELWLVPKGAIPPESTPTMSPPKVNLSAAYKFDEECLECAPAVGLYLYGLDEGLKFYAGVLRENPNSQGLIVVRPGEHVRTRQALKEASQARKLLARKHKINVARIIIRAGRRRNDNVAVAEMWVIPRGAKLSSATSNKLLQRDASIASFSSILLKSQVGSCSLGAAEQQRSIASRICQLGSSGSSHLSSLSFLLYHVRLIRSSKSVEVIHLFSSCPGMAFLPQSECVAMRGNVKSRVRISTFTG